MRVKLLIPLAFVLAATPPAVADTPDPAVAARLAADEQAAAFLRDKRPGAALGVLEPIVTGIDAQIAERRKKALVFCGTSMTEGLVYSMLGAKEKKDAVVFEHDVCDTYYLYAFALMDVGRTADGIAVWEKLTQLSPMHSAYFSELGYAYRTTGQTDKAVAAYKQALDFASMAGEKQEEKFERGRALRGLGFIQVDRGDLDGGERLYREALKNDPDNETTKSELKYIAEQRAKKK